MPRGREPSAAAEGRGRGHAAPAQARARLAGAVRDRPGLHRASVYFAVGVVAAKALGLTWAVFLAGAVFFAVLVPSYVEGASLHQERGGATVIARYAFNELWSFVAGWAILLDYLILIALTAFATTDYAAVFFEPFDSGAPEFLLGAAVVDRRRDRQRPRRSPRRYERAALIVLADLVLQTAGRDVRAVARVPAGGADRPGGSIAGTPSLEDLVFAFPLVLVAFSGIDASSGLAGQVAIGRRGLRRLIGVRLIAACVPYVGIALVASVALPTQPGSDVGGGADGRRRRRVRRRRGPRAAALRAGGLRRSLILVAACNAAMLGLSRLGYSLAVNRQIPSLVGYLHPRARRRWWSSASARCWRSRCCCRPTSSSSLGIYAFGATIAFTIVHRSVIRLRWREPDRDRPYKMPLNVRIGRGELPVPPCSAALMSLAALRRAALLPRRRALGRRRLDGLRRVALYVYYRISEDKPVLKRVTVPEKTLTRPRQEAEYGSILVPIRGRPLDDDIVQTAGRLAAEENEDVGEGGAVIEALWVFEVPMALPLDARVPDEDLKRARKALARAKAVGEEYEGVEVATAVVRARRAGEAIVREARRRGVEAIVLAAEEPTRMRGGPLLGGKARAPRHVRGRDDALRGQQGAVPRDPHRAADRPRAITSSAPPRGPSPPRRRRAADPDAAPGDEAPPLAR